MEPRDLRDGYDRSAPRYEERFAALQAPKLDAVLARVAPRGRVLDVGCGTGFLAARLESTAVLPPVALSAIGVDLSFEMLRRGRGTRLQGDAVALPFRDASFDTAFAITSLLTDVPRSLVEIRRVLRAGGKLAVTLLASEAPNDFERELRAAGFAPLESFACGQDRGWIAERR